MEDDEEDFSRYIDTECEECGRHICVEESIFGIHYTNLTCSKCKENRSKTCAIKK